MYIGILTMPRIFLFLYLLFSCGILHAQDFGDRFYPLEGFRSLGIAAGLDTFIPLSTNTEKESSRVHFNAPSVGIEYRELNTRVNVSYTPYSLQGKNTSALTISVLSMYDFPIGMSQNNRNWLIPVVLSTNYVRVGLPEGSSQDFNIASVGLGSGLKYRTIQQLFALQVQAVGIFHYSSEGFGFENGTSLTAGAEIQFLLPEIAGEGLVLGYQFLYQQWTMKNSQWNYGRTTHGLFIGIFF
jgi:hypothetical protein